MREPIAEFVGDADTGCFVFRWISDKAADLTYRDCEKTVRHLLSGLEVRLFYHPEKCRVIYVQLRRGKDHEPIGWADTYHGLGFDPMSVLWHELYDAKDDLRNASLPAGITHHAKSDRLLYGLDGEVFSFPTESIAEIQDAIDDFAAGFRK